MNNMKMDGMMKNTILYKSLMKCKSVLISTLWFTSGINLLVLFLPIYTSQVLDRVVSNSSTATLTMLTILVITTFIISGLLEMSRSFIMSKINNWLDEEVTLELVKRAISLITFNKSISTGEIIRDFGNVRGFLTGQGIFSLCDVPWAFIYLIVIYFIHWMTGIVATVGIILLIGMTVWNNLSTKKLMRESMEMGIKNTYDIEIATRNSEVVEAMGMSDNILNLWNRKNSEHRSLQYNIAKRASIIMAVTKFLRSTLQIGVIGLGAFLTIAFHKTSGSIIAGSILMGRVLAPFEMAINQWKAFSTATTSYKRLQSILISAPNRTEAMQLPMPLGNICFDRVIFTPYGTNKPTLKGLAFDVDAGNIIGVIGNSASGKSTMAKLLVGVYKPIAGTVRLDGADVYTWNRNDFGKHVGYLPQDIELFSASIKHNIARMSEDLNPEWVVNAAKIAGVHKLILSLSDGYDTIIGPEGISLSGGQKQRIGLARAFYGEIKLLVLDEPNSNLDQEGEKALVEALRYAYKNKITTFLMTHKMSILSYVQKIMILNDGVLVKFGDRDVIMNELSKNTT
ncbi:MAG: type I secretion system permease/ATPase [Anaplasmataceae bacterium]|nr:type I secretion system permease/ATPase [Anaplasmataceae bacterium]